MQDFNLSGSSNLCLEELVFRVFVVIVTIEVLMSIRNKKKIAMRVQTF